MRFQRPSELSKGEVRLTEGASSRRQHLVPTASVPVSDVLVSLVTAVQDLGIYMDTDVTMKTHITNIIRACFLALCQIRSVQRSLPQHTLLT